MQLIKSAVASINHNDKDDVRVDLSIARGDDGLYFIVTDSGEDTMDRFDTEQEAMDGIAAKWGSSPDWGLEFANA